MLAQLKAAAANPRSVAKSLSALVGAVVTALVASGALNPIPPWLSILAAVATGVGVWAVSNA